MRQFYTLTTKGDAGKYEKLEFVKPVRKMCVISDVSPAYLRFVFPDDSASSTFFVPVGEPLYLDFQSANNGTGGNIDWYK